MGRIGRVGAATWQEVAALGPHGLAWDDLVARADRPTPFQRRWWLETGTTSRRRFVLVTRDAELVGGLALDVDRLGVVPRYRFATQGLLCPDHLDVVAHPDHRDLVLDACRAWLTAVTPCVLDLDGLVEASLAERFVGVASRPTDVAPYGVLPRSGDAWLAERSSSFRRSVRRSAKDLAAAGLHPRRSAVADLDRAIDDFVALHATRPGRQDLLTQVPALRPALRAGAGLDEVWVHRLGDDRVAAAVSISFVLGDRIHLWQVARSTDPAHAGAGTVLLAHVVGEAADAGLGHVDLLRGGEAYKSSYVGSRHEVHRLRTGLGRSGRLTVAALAGARGARRWLRERRT